ncbi:hypothetical protein [Haloechinothrix halophila]|uniref:hypothetical protein n=1 Tax=Haloechinothrix halophila TaxID=1069073 RepID=UPI0012FB43F3|nr:hypothetical protein [Haloechinothrix halophila]
MARRRWVAASGVLLAALAVAGYVVVPSLAHFAGGTSPTMPDDAHVAVPTFGERGSDVLAYQDGDTFTMTFPLVNDGWLPVTVRDVLLSDGPRPLVRVTSVTSHGTPLPVTVPAGETRRVELTVRFDNCRYYHEREMQVISGAVVDGSVFGRDLRTTAGFEHDLVVSSPMIASCPDRTLRRDDDVRR